MPTFTVSRLGEPEEVKKPSRIFVCSMADLFGDWVPSYEIQLVIQRARAVPRHTYIFLTKNPSRLKEFNPWPDNAWVGATATDRLMHSKALTGLNKVKARVKFISYEPILSKVMLPYPFEPWSLKGINWAILGAQTNPLKLPRQEWVSEIEKAAEQAGTKVFEKNNLASLFPDRKLRQELPT